MQFPMQLLALLLAPAAGRYFRAADRRLTARHSAAGAGAASRQSEEPDDSAASLADGWRTGGFDFINNVISPQAPINWDDPVGDPLGAVDGGESESPVTAAPEPTTP